ASRLPGPVVGWPGGQGRCTTVCVVAVSSWVETSQTVPSLRAGLPPGLDGPVRGCASGGGVGALLGPEGTGPAPAYRVPLLPCGGWGVCAGGGVVGGGGGLGLLSRWRWECRSRIGPCWWRVSAWRWVLRWPWGVCELDSGCEHLDLIDLLMSDLNSLFWSGFCCSALIPNVVLFGCVSELGRTVDALVPGADEGRGGPR